MRAAWFAVVLAALAGGDEQAVPPPPAGEAADRADLTIWFIDDPSLVARWHDRERFDHSELLEILRDAGHRPRILHLSEAEFPGRWTGAREEGRLPQVLVVSRFRGEVEALHRAGEFRTVAHERLTFDESACPDLARSFLFLPGGASHTSEARDAVFLRLRRAKSPRLTGPALPAESGRLTARRAARRRHAEGRPAGTGLGGSPGWRAAPGPGVRATLR